MKGIEEGTVIRATHRPEHLIPALKDEVIRIANLNPNWIGNMTLPDGIDGMADDDPYWESDDAVYDLEHLFDILDSMAPDGMYFGCHMGDGSDYGFWTVEDEQ